MNEWLIHQIEGTVRRIYDKNGHTPVTEREIVLARCNFNGRKTTSDEVREALNILCERGWLTGLVYYSGKRPPEYVPHDHKTTQEKILEVVRSGFGEAQFFDHIPTDEEILAVLADNMRLMVGAYMKLNILTRDGSIARQMVERLHFECCILHPRSSVRKSWLLKADPNDRIKSTMAERRRILADLAAKGFVRAVNHKVAPNIPYPSWSVYARSNQ